MSSRSRRVHGLAALAVAGWTAQACGPYFPNRIGDENDEAILQAPVGVFVAELERIVPASVSARERRWLNDPRSSAQRTADADNGDLRAALFEAHDPARDPLLGAYARAREAIASHVRDVRRWESQCEWRGLEEPLPPRPGLAPPEIPANLPAEFDLYLRGAVAWHSGATNEAAAQWDALMALPAGLRAWRSTWAAYMLGRVRLSQGRPLDAIPRFRSVRQLCSQGFRDSLDLRTVSLGWEARAERQLGRTPRAVELYVEQFALGDPTAANSLRFVAHATWAKDSAELARAVTNTTVRRVLTAYALSHFGSGAAASTDQEKVRRLLAAMENAGVRNADETDRLAWAAYRAGDYGAAERWARVAPDSSVITRLVRAKLLLRSGRIDEAVSRLAELSRAFPEAPAIAGPDWQYWWGTDAWDLSREPLGSRVRGELGVLCLSRGEYVQAMDWLLRGGYGEDAAYVAERVLTLPELKAYVDATWPAGDDGPLNAWLASDFWAIDQRETPAAHVRYLLGRRLVRGNRLAEARGYLPSSLQPDAARLEEALRTGEDTTSPAGRRARALWRAACLTRYRGMELMGTELDPDWTTYKGAYDVDPFPAVRAEAAGETGVVRMSDEEGARVKASECEPNRRFHYRLKATDLAWRAAELMPDQSDDTARVLCLAGTWIKVRYPEAAGRFYRALVRRCGRTALGGQAEALRWFPDVSVDPQALLSGD